jgi:hypothetical protein
MMESNCPRCKKQMSEGFVWTPYGMRWRTDGRRHHTAFGSEPLVSGWRTRGLPAARCQPCGLVLIDSAEVA